MPSVPLVCLCLKRREEKRRESGMPNKPKSSGGPNPPPESREFCRMSDVCIEREVQRQKCNLDKLSNLPDYGHKIRLRVTRLQAELHRRRVSKLNVDGLEKPIQSMRHNFTSASCDFVETTPSALQGSQSEFCALFSDKLDKKRKDKRSTRGRQKSTLSSWKSPFQCPTKLAVDADKRKLSNDDENGHCSRNLKEISPRSFMKRHRPSLPLASKDSRQSNEDTYILVDEEGVEPESEQAEEVDECLKDSKVYYPTRNDPECVEVCYRDMECLAPQAYLSSTIMNFYIRHLQEPTLATEISNTDYHFFNTYFYNKLQEAVPKKDKKEGSFSKLRRWWKGINIFQKAYILFPVHEDLHWSLVIICIPDKEDDSGPIILHLDSLGLHSSRSIFNNVKSFLIEEWKHLIKGEVPLDLPISGRIWKNLSRRIEEKIIKVPQQKNEYDCGLFVLYFIERFIVDAPERLKKKDLAMFGRNWFKPKEASNLRQIIKKRLMKEFRKAAQNNEE